MAPEHDLNRPDFRVVLGIAERNWIFLEIDNAKGDFKITLNTSP